MGIAVSSQVSGIMVTGRQRLAQHRKISPEEQHHEGRRTEGLERPKK